MIKPTEIAYDKRTKDNQKLSTNKLDQGNFVREREMERATREMQ